MTKHQDWIRLEDFIEQQVAAAIAQLDAVIAEHEGRERAAMLRSRPRAVAKIEAAVRQHYAHQAELLSVPVDVQH